MCIKCRFRSQLAAAMLKLVTLQVESFAVILKRLVGSKANAGPSLPNSSASSPPSPGCRFRIVDFGCGTGGVLLPLAHLFPDCDFVGEMDGWLQSNALMRWSNGH